MTDILFSSIYFQLFYFSPQVGFMIVVLPIPSKG